MKLHINFQGWLCFKKFVIETYVFDLFCRRQREVRESPGSSTAIEDACLLSSPNDDVLILGQNDDNRPLLAVHLTDSTVSRSFCQAIYFLNALPACS